MKITRIYLVGIVVLVVVNLFLLFQLRKTIVELKKQHSLQENKETVIEDQFEYINKMNTKRVLEFQTEGKMLPSVVLPFKALKNNIFVLNISEKDCFSCYSEVFEVVKSALVNVAKEKIIVIGKHQEKSKLRAFAINNIKQGIMVNTYGEELALPIQEATVPYAFILDKNKKITAVYGFNKMNIAGAKNYLKMVIEKYHLSDN